MTVKPPTLEQLREVAARYRLHLADADLASFRGLMEPALASYARLDQLAEPGLPVKYPRAPGQRPAPADNPLGAWYWKSTIAGAPSGPLAGKTVAIKDNVCVAGLPMMNGTSVLEGYVPPSRSSLFAVVMISHSVLATRLYNSTRGSVLATLLYHHSIHMASVIPLLPGVAGGVVMALVHVGAAAAAVFASGGSLAGIRGTRLAGPSVKPVSPSCSPAEVRRWIGSAVSPLRCGGAAALRRWDSTAADRPADQRLGPLAAEDRREIDRLRLGSVPDQRATGPGCSPGGCPRGRHRIEGAVDGTGSDSLHG